MPSAPSRKKTIVVVAPHMLIREGIKSLLRRITSVELLADAENFESLSEILLKQRVDIVLADYLHHTGMDIEEIRTLRTVFPSAELVVISSTEDPEAITALLNVGASGIIFKECDQAEFVNAIRAAVHHDQFYCHKVLDIAMPGRPEADSNCEPVRLSPREREIIAWVSRGFSSRDIADKLCISEHTVSTHRKNISRKLGLKTVGEWTLYSLRMGLIKSA